MMEFKNEAHLEVTVSEAGILIETKESGNPSGFVRGMRDLIAIKVDRYIDEMKKEVKERSQVTGQ